MEIIVDRLLREFKVSANVGKPQVAYRETITATAKAEGSFIRQGALGACTLRVEPNERGAGFTFANELNNDEMTPAFIDAVREGAENSYQTGPLAGFPMVDVKAHLVSSEVHESDSNEADSDELDSDESDSDQTQLD